MGRSKPALHALNASPYQIFDEDFAKGGRVVIWSRSPFPPRLGDLFNIETGGVLHELAVREVRTLMGGWTATCRAQTQ